MKNSTDFRGFLNSLELDSYEEIYELANAIKDGISGNLYEVKDGKGKSDTKITSCKYVDVELAIVSEKAKTEFMRILEDEYMSGLDKETFWSIEREKEKN